jgi:hypothetical protein
MTQAPLEFNGDTGENEPDEGKTLAPSLHQAIFPTLAPTLAPNLHQTFRPVFAEGDSRVLDDEVACTNACTTLAPTGETTKTALAPHHPPSLEGGGWCNDGAKLVQAQNSHKPEPPTSSPAEVLGEYAAADWTNPSTTYPDADPWADSEADRALESWAVEVDATAERFAPALELAERFARPDVAEEFAAILEQAPVIPVESAPKRAA